MWPQSNHSATCPLHIFHFCFPLTSWSPLRESQRKKGWSNFPTAHLLQNPAKITQTHLNSAPITTQNKLLYKTQLHNFSFRIRKTVKKHVDESIHDLINTRGVNNVRQVMNTPQRATEWQRESGGGRQLVNAQRQLWWHQNLCCHQGAAHHYRRH